MVKIQDKSKYIRVSEVLSPFSGLASVPKDIVKRAADRGTKVHLACEGIIKGLSYWEDDPQIQPYIDSFNQWWDNSTIVVTQEQRFYCDKLGITGQCDLILQSEDNSQAVSIIDFKTSYKPSNTWAIQGSAYAYLAREAGYAVDKITFIHLQKDGSPPDIYHYHDRFDIFLKCLDLYKYFNNKEI